MSKTENIKQNYISKVHLKGYKSIQDVEIDLLPGMNIIIGPNGSGKTNFLEFVDAIINNDEDEYSPGINGKLDLIVKNEKRVIELKFQIKSLKSGESKINDINYTLSLDNSSLRNESPQIYLFREGVAYQKVKYGITNNMIGTQNGSILFFKKIGSEIYPSFQKVDLQKNQFNRILNHFIMGFLSSNSDKAKLVKYLNTRAFEDLNKTLSFFSPIEEIRISEDLRIIQMRDEINIENIVIQFKVKDNWLYWSQISDGTKRIFYVITQLLGANKGIYLIDEPELGLHPDQLHSLMQFLKEQAETKQIILTTHSPQVLNTLKVEDEELNRLIVSRIGENGTEMVKLSDEEKQWAKDALEEGLSLADYWVYSGIEAEKLS